MTVKMRVLVVLGLWLAVCKAILVRSAGNTSAVDMSAVRDNRETADQITPQESNERSTFYADHYPEDQGVAEHGYDFELPRDHYPPYDHYPPHNPYPSHHRYPHHHYGHDTALKALLLPLAGVALLGAAAVFASNPVLLQLGVVSGRRRRRELLREGPAADRLHDVLMLEKFMSQLPRDQLAREERRLLATYLTCSGVNRDACLERLACEVFQPGASVSPAEQRVMDIIIHEVMNNEFIVEEIKINIMKARKAGHFGEGCGHYPCQQLDKQRMEGKEEESG